MARRLCPLWFCSLVDMTTGNTLPETLQIWLHFRQLFRLFAFSSSKQTLGLVCDMCAHRIANTAAMTPPLPLNLDSPPGPGAVRVS